MKLLVIVFISLLSFSSYAESLKIGFIDSTIVVNSLPQYKKSLEIISKEFEPKKQELLDLFNHIELLRSKIDSIGKSNPSENIQLELTKLENLELSFMQETEFWQKTMNDKKIDLLKEVELIINQTIITYAIKENYDLILYENVAFVSDKIDITQEIIKEIEKQK